MSEFKIYQHEDKTIHAVKLGWSWPALMFGPLWAITKGMWKLAFAITIPMYVIYQLIGDDSKAGIYLAVAASEVAVHIGFGAFGNELRRRQLEQQGYVPRAVISASTDVGAKSLFEMNPR